MAYQFRREEETPVNVYQIYDDTGTIRISYNSVVKHIAKPSIVEVGVINGSIIKISTGSVLEAIYINHEEVADPFSYSADHLRELINTMLNCLCCHCSGSEAPPQE